MLMNAQQNQLYMFNNKPNFTHAPSVLVQVTFMTCILGDALLVLTAPV